MPFLASKKFFKKLGVLLFLVFMIMAPAQKTYAQYVDISNAIKEYVADPIAFQVANMMIKKMTISTVNWINSGFQGNPSFVTDPGQFFLNVADDQAAKFLSSKSMSNICAPFQPQVRIALAKSYLQQDIQNYSCNLNILKNNYDQFTQDFSQGGWSGWFEVTQNNSNNPYGSYLEAQDSMDKQLASQVSKYSTQLLQGRGFLSFEQCPEGQTVTQAEVDQSNQDAGYDTDTSAGGGTSADGLQVGDCKVAKQTVTPGSAIQDQLDKAIGSGQNRINVADEVDEIIGSLFSQFANKALNSVLGLSQPSNGNASTLDQLSQEQEAPLSNPNAGNITMSPGSIVCQQEPDQTLPDGTIVHGKVTCTATTGTANLCTASPNSRGNDPGAPSTIDPANIKFIEPSAQTNVANWSVTGSLNTVTASPTDINFAYSLGNSWPSFSLGGSVSNNGFASTWVLFWRKDIGPEEPLPSNIQTDLTTLLNELTFFRNNWLQNKSSGIPDVSPTPWLMAGDSQGGLLGIGGNTISDKQNYFNKLSGETSDQSTPSSGILYQVSLVKFDMTQNVTKYPKAWAYMSTEAGNMQSQLDNFEPLFTAVLQRSGQKATTLDFDNFQKDSSLTIPAADALIEKVQNILTPPPVFGHWVAFPFDYLLDSSPNDVSIAGIFCNSQDFEPVAGDTYGFMLSTPAGSDAVASNAQNVRERTNIIPYLWPEGITRPVPASDNTTVGSSSGSGECTAANTHPALTPIDDATLATYVEASYMGFWGKPDTQSDIDYWVKATDHYGMYSDQICRAGWNAYMEQRLAPGNTGSSDPALGDQLPKFLP